MLKIGFWSKETGNLMAHKSGLTPEQLVYLRQLKEGDRLILWFNSDKRSSSSPSYTLKKYQPKHKED